MQGPTTILNMSLQYLGKLESLYCDTDLQLTVQQHWAYLSTYLNRGVVTRRGGGIGACSPVVVRKYFVDQ